MREYVYREQQVGWGLLFGLFASDAIALPLAWHFDPHHNAMLHLVIWSVFLGTVLFLGRLTVEVNPTELRWTYGWLGWPGGRVALADIERVEPGSFRWQEGWGIRTTRSGKLYNIAGRQTLRVVKRDGSSFRLGTADLRGLQNALAHRLGPAR